jgi:hypothetical protein
MRPAQRICWRNCRWCTAVTCKASDTKPVLTVPLYNQMWCKYSRKIVLQPIQESVIYFHSDSALLEQLWWWRFYPLKPEIDLNNNNKLQVNVSWNLMRCSLINDRRERAACNLRIYFYSEDRNSTLSTVDCIHLPNYMELFHRIVVFIVIAVTTVLNFVCTSRPITKIIVSLLFME